MYKSCSKCGKIHDTSYICTAGTPKTYSGGEERKLRSSNRWKQKSLEIRERANYLCEVCRAEGIYTYNNVQVHHIDKVTEDKTRLLDNYNLICLCTEHHKQADNGKLSKDRLFTLAGERERK